MKCDNCRYTKMCIRRFHPMGDTFNCEHYEEYEQRPHGEWTEEFDESANPFFQRRWRCSACNDYNYYGRPDFCPCCGADMREGDAE